MSKKRGVQVNNPNSVVLVDNVSSSVVCLPREEKDDVLLEPNKTAQITWAEFVKFKNIPHFGRFIKLNDSVVISDGIVKIKNVAGDLSNDEMVEVLVQGVDRLKEFTQQLNPAELELFSNFLTQRVDLGIEKEKCEEVLAFIQENLSSKLPKKAVKKTKAKKATDPVETKEKPKRKRGRPAKKQGDVVVTENEEVLAAHVERTKDDKE